MQNIAFVFLFLLSAGLSACSSEKKEEPKEARTSEAAERPNEYPDLILKLMNGQDVSAKQLTGNNVFILFFPDCDHCQEEAVAIEQRLEDFKDYTLYFISSAPMEQITSFAETFRLQNKDNVEFAWTTTEGVLNHYGAVRTPSIYIYSNGKLKGSFNGQTDVDKIINAL